MPPPSSDSPTHAVHPDARRSAFSSLSIAPHWGSALSKQKAMVGHGTRTDPKPSAAGGFECIVCGIVINVSDSVVGFNNCNKNGRASWDHVHSEKCADLYVPPPQADTSDASATSSVRNAVSSAWNRLTGGKRKASSAEEWPFLKRAAQLEFSAAQAQQVLEEHGGNEEAAFKAMSDAFLADAVDELDRGESSLPASNPINDESAERASTSSSDEELPSKPPSLPAFSSNAAREAVYDVFSAFLKPMLPKPQTNGSFKDGDPALLDVLMTTPTTLALPRAERLADLIKPPGGWDEPSIERARSFFGLAAAGVQFLIYIPTITHRQQLSRNPLFAVTSSDGETVGVRDCCPSCRSNSFVNVTDGKYNVRYKKDSSRNGVRFIYSSTGCMVPISRSCVCRNPLCPPNVAKLQARKLTAPDPGKQLPRGKAPDSRPWPSSEFSTHSKAYIQLVAVVVTWTDRICSKSVKSWSTVRK